MAAFLAGTLGATVEISTKKADLLFVAIENNLIEDVQQFFQDLYRTGGQEAVETYANLRNSENQTPLHLAQGHEVVETLLRYGANLNARDSQNRLPLVAIFSNNETEIAQDILSFIPRFLSNLLMYDRVGHDRILPGLIANLDSVFDSTCIVGIRLDASELRRQIARVRIEPQPVVIQDPSRRIQTWINEVAAESENQTFEDPIPTFDYPNDHSFTLTPSSSTASL